MIGEWSINVRRLIDVTVEMPSSGRRTSTTGEPPCILSCNDRNNINYNVIGLNRWIKNRTKRFSNINKVFSENELRW